MVFVLLFLVVAARSVHCQRMDMRSRQMHHRPAMHHQPTMHHRPAMHHKHHEGRLFHPPFAATTIEVLPKFKVVAERGPLIFATGIAFPFEFEVHAKPEHEEMETEMMEAEDMRTHTTPFAPHMGPEHTEENTIVTENAQMHGRTTKRQKDRKERQGWLSHRGRRSIEMPRELMERLQLYRSMSLSMDRMGFQGEPCLLRAICEAEKFQQIEDEGLFGRIVTLLLTVPENNFNELDSYNKAVSCGRQRNCSIYDDCPVSIFKTVTLR